MSLEDVQAEPSISSEKIKNCLTALHKDQKEFHKRNGRFAAHVNQLHHSEREECSGVILMLRRKSSQDYRITGEMGGTSGTITQNEKIIWAKGS